MFQTFKGSSRRPRQVNLSGQNIDPFAASSWTPTASGTQKTVAVAQQERRQRQLERDRLEAIKKIQKTWRGHKCRTDLAVIQRREWDALEQSLTGETEASWTRLPEELRLLLAFYNTRDGGDIERLSRLSDRLISYHDSSVLTATQIRPYVLRLSNILLSSMVSRTSGFQANFLQLLVAIVESNSHMIPRLVSRYYATLSSVVTQKFVFENHHPLIIAAVRAPLQTYSSERASGRPHRTLATYETRIDYEPDAIISEAYRAFAMEFLTTPYLEGSLGGLQELAEILDVGLLSEIIAKEPFPLSKDIHSERLLWLLAHLVVLCHLKQGVIRDPVYMRALSVLLSAGAHDIVGHIDEEQSRLTEDKETEDETQTEQKSLPAFIKDAIISLVNKESITGLISRFDSSQLTVSTSGRESDGSLLANYALVLLRIFPRSGEDIHLWLYQGAESAAGTTSQLPAVKLFWKAMSTTRTFSAVCNDPSSALGILRRGLHAADSSESALQNVSKNQDWRTILLFLELYSFVLKFTDDEEFLNDGMLHIEGQNHTVSRSRESALPLEDVKLLTVFLKNLSFTMYFNAAEISEDDNYMSEGGLGNYFGTSSSKMFIGATQPETHDSDGSKKASRSRSFLGISGMSFLYVRGIVTRVMRMLYERDSRRRFLPKDHWLMTSRFDMEGFIPAVVAEEERRHEIGDSEDNEEEDEDDQLASGSYGGVVGLQHSRRVVQLESLRRQQEKASRRKVLAAIGPRLEILQNMPFTIPFPTRVQIFRQFVLRDQIRRRGGYADPDNWRMSLAQGNHSMARDVLNRHHAKIRRENVFQDALDEFYELGEGLKEPIQITFVDQFGSVEAGIDGGGVTKEFLTSVTTEAFRPSENLFVTNDQNLLYPNPTYLDETRDVLRGVFDESSPAWHAAINKILQRYEFLGRVVGKCLYEGILVDIAFAGFFLLKWSASDNSGSRDSGYLANINDLRDLDEPLYQGLLQLKNYPGNVEDFSLDFTIDDIISAPGEPTRTITRALMRNGANIPVTNENRVVYIPAVAKHRLHLQPYRQTRAFLRGLEDIIKPSWLSMFNQVELQTLLSGDRSEIDVEDLRRNTAYGGVYQIGDDGLEHPTIQHFWKVMRELDDTDRRKVLKYVTSTPRAPLLGFSQLNPRFSIRDAGSDEQRLPSTSTCVNLMKLPRYSTVKVLREKLLYAVNSGAGFDLS